MGKQKHKPSKADSAEIVFNSTATFHVMCGSPEGYNHEYTIVTYQSNFGTHYIMNYADNSNWSEKLRGAKIYHLLNTGNGYEWLDTDPMTDKIEYDEFFTYTTFMRLIQKIEGRYMCNVIHVVTLDSFNY